jgi:hypothetical protein
MLNQADEGIEFDKISAKGNDDAYGSKKKKIRNSEGINDL